VIATVRDVVRGLSEQTINNLDQPYLQILYRALREVETRFVREVGFGFVPERRTLTLYTPYGDGRVSSDGYSLTLRRPLLEAVTISNGGAGAVAASGYHLESLHDLSDTPYSAAVLEGTRWANDSRSSPVEIDGIWGYHTAYDDAWWPSGDTVKTLLSDTATSLEVDDASGPDTWGETPRFSPGQLLQIESAESAVEWLEVMAVDTSNNVLTVRRGVNGSTAAEHAATTGIDTWQADPQAMRAIQRWTGLLFVRRGAYETVSFDGMAQVQFPTDVPDEVAKIARTFRSLFELPFEAV
jgi:hypothetical protein